MGSVRTGLQEPVLGISLITRTGCWLKSGLLNFSPRIPLFMIYFGKPLIDLLLTFNSETQD